MIEIKPLLPEQWQLYKAVRCAALAEAPYAYSSTLQDALERSDKVWRKITRQYASHPNSLTYFAFEDDNACGTSACAMNGDEVELYAVWVDPGYRRKGIGRALIDYGRAWAQSKGAKQLKVGIFEENPAALAFYRSMGFKDSGSTYPGLSTAKRRLLLYIMFLQ